MSELCFESHFVEINRWLIVSLGAVDDEFCGVPRCDRHTRCAFGTTYQTNAGRPDLRCLTEQLAVGHKKDVRRRGVPDLILNALKGADRSRSHRVVVRPL
jgi:hypothetical protein